MSDAVIVAIISSIVTLIGVYFQNVKTVAVIETKLDIISHSVEKHSKIAEEIPAIKEQIKSADRRISDLEKYKWA